MPWENNGNKGQNPWGKGPNRGGGNGGGGGNEPNIEEVFKRGQEKLKSALPGGGGKPMFMLAFLVVIVLWIASGLYKVGTNEQGVVLRFGERTILTQPGLHWHLPWPVETVEVRAVTEERTITIGNGSTRRSGQPDESLMLTQDDNIVEIRFNVVWQIEDLGNYLFKLRDPEGTIRAVAQSVMREIVGKNEIIPIITTRREQIQRQALEQTKEILASYESGVRVLRVQIVEAQAPDEVKDAFLDVQRAEADQQRSRNEATRYANEVIPRAEGEAERLLQEAEAYRAQTVARAEGEAARFTSVYNEYVAAKDVTRKRIYLETMEEILSGMDKIILQGDGTGVVPYLPLNELNRSKQEEK